MTIRLIPVQGDLRELEGTVYGALGVIGYHDVDGVYRHIEMEFFEQLPDDPDGVAVFREHDHE